MTTIKPIVHCVSCEDLHGDARKIFDDFIQKTGKVPKWLQVMGNCEDTMIGFFSLFKSVMDNAPVSSVLKWKVAYVVSDINKCAFCIGATKLKLAEFNISEDDLKNIDHSTEAKEQLAIEYARATTEHAYNIAPELIERMQKTFTDEEIVEITAVIGTFSFLNRFNDALRILPDIQ